MLIKVTQEHIDQGKPRDCASCPIAKAINSLLKDKYSCEVASRVMTIREIDAFKWILGFDTPETCAKFIIKFDNLKPVEPFEFELDIHEDKLCLFK